MSAWESPGWMEELEAYSDQWDRVCGAAFNWLENEREWMFSAMKRGVPFRVIAREHIARMQLRVARLKEECEPFK